MIPNRYNLDTLKEAIRNPVKFYHEFNRVLNDFRGIYFHQKYGQGIDVMEQDWDNLIILDACRFDVFESVNSIPGKLDCVISRGSHSEEFYRNGFSNGPFKDTIIVTANPYTPIVCNNQFYRIITTFSGTRTVENLPRIEKIEDESGRLLEASHIENVHPKYLNKLAIDVIQENPNKRLIVHYMQPHDPYLGDTARRVRDQFRREGFEFSYWKSLDEIDEDKKNLPGLMALATRGKLDPSVLRELYEENLRIVMEYVEDLLTKIDGKTVVTSDHGELLGDRCVRGQKFFHEKRLFAKELRMVPWLTIESENRRRIVEEDTVANNDIDDHDISAHLELLGYK